MSCISIKVYAFGAANMYILKFNKHIKYLIYDKLYIYVLYLVFICIDMLYLYVLICCMYMLSLIYDMLYGILCCHKKKKIRKDEKIPKLCNNSP